MNSHADDVVSKAMKTCATFKLIRYGPVETRAGDPFNLQADGSSSALWFEVEGGGDCVLAVEFDGLFLKSAQSGKNLSALVPSSMIEEPRKVLIRIVDENLPEQSVQLDFHVLKKDGSKVSILNPKYAYKLPKPDFFMIGPPRGGTTTMYWQLSAHPEVYMARIKEPYFFDPRAPDVLDEAIVGEEQYMQLFKFAPFSAKKIGEASTTYSSCPEALRRINDFNPEAKILMILRNPIEACVSLYLQHRKGRRHEQATSFQQAWDECKAENVRPFISNYRELYRIGDQLENTAKIFGLKRLHVMLFDDLTQDGVSTYAKLLVFLGLQQYDLKQLDKTNSSQLKDIKTEISPGLLREMRDYFLPQIKIVANFTGRSLDHWLF